MGRTRLERAIAQIKRDIELCENYKKRILKHVESIKDKYLKNEITFYEYELLINQKLDGKSVQEWLNHYNSHKQVFMLFYR